MPPLILYLSCYSYFWACRPCTFYCQIYYTYLLIVCRLRHRAWGVCTNCFLHTTAMALIVDGRHQSPILTLASTRWYMMPLALVMYHVNNSVISLFFCEHGLARLSILLYSISTLYEHCMNGHCILQFTMYEHLHPLNVFTIVLVAMEMCCTIYHSGIHRWCLAPITCECLFVILFEYVR